jgi:hypothetical protein
MFNKFLSIFVENYKFVDIYFVMLILFENISSYICLLWTTVFYVFALLFHFFFYLCAILVEETGVPGENHRHVASH